VVIGKLLGLKSYERFNRARYEFKGGASEKGRARLNSLSALGGNRRLSLQQTPTFPANAGIQIEPNDAYPLSPEERRIIPSRSG